MQNVLLFAVFLILGTIWCNEELFAKFHQHAYKIKDARIQSMDYNKSFYNIFEIKAFKYNRTIAAHNATVNSKIATGDKLEVLVQVYKLLSNEYRHFPIRFQINAKKAFEANIVGLSSMKNCGNMTSFVFEKDITYHMCNFLLDETHFPPLIPTGKFKAEMTIMYFNTYMSLINCFFEIYVPIPYPKKKQNLHP